MTLLLTVCSGAWANQTTLITNVTLPDVPTASLDLASQTTYTPDVNGWIVFNAYSDIATNPQPSWWTFLGSRSSQSPQSNFTAEGSTTTAPFKDASTGFKINKYSPDAAIRFTGAEKASFLVSARSTSSNKEMYIALFTYASGNTSSQVQVGNTFVTSSKDPQECLFSDLSSDNTYIAYIYGGSSGQNGSLMEIALKAPTESYTISWANGGRGTAPTEPTSGSSVTLPTMDTDGGWSNTGWTANQAVKVGGEEKAAGAFLASGTTVGLTANTTFTGVWQQASSFALTSATEVEVKTTSQIATSGAAGTVTYESADASIATVSASGLITAVAPGKTTITITDPGSAEVASGSATVTVLVPYEAVAADSYVFKIGNYKFANNDNTKYYFDNGFTMTLNNAAECQYANLDDRTGIKYSHARQYTINVPDDVTVTYAVIKARNNYASGNAAANWGTIFGTDYSSIELPYSGDDAVEKDFVVETPVAGADLTFQPGGNQWQAIITLYTIAYHAKYTVSFDKGDGTGSMDDVEVRGGSTYTLPASSFTAPTEKGFDGWLCSVDDLVYAAGAEYTMTDANTTFTAQYAGVEGKMIIKAVLQSASKADITGAIGGTYTAGGNVQNRSESDGGCKLGKDGAWIAITLSSGWTFKEGDIVKVNIGTGASGTFAFYKDNEGTEAILTTTETGSTGLHTFVLPAAAEGEISLYLVRTANSNFNPFIDYIEVYRPGDNVVTLNSKGFATYSYNKDFAIYGATAYAMALDIDAGTLTGTAVDKVPAGAGILLKGEAGASVQILETTGAAALTGNNLHGTTDANGNTVDMPAGKTVYVLSGDTFKKFTGTELAANKAFFQVDGTTVEGRSFVMVFDGETTGIDALLIDNGQLTIDNAVYNLNGQRVMNPAKGLYIVNGRKVVIK